MSIRTKASEVRRFWHAIFLYHKAVFPHGLGLVVFRTLSPFVRRVFTVLIMLGSLRVFLGAIDSGNNAGDFFESAQPIFLGVAAFLIFPPLTDIASLYFRQQTSRMRKGVRFKAIAKRVDFEPVQIKAWCAHQDRFLAYFVAMPFVYLMMFWAADKALIAYIVSEIFFWLLLAAVTAGFISANTARSAFMIEAVAYVAFAVYVLLLAYLLFTFPPADFHVEALFLIIMMPRIQYSNMRRAARFVLNTKDTGDEDDRGA